VRLINSNLQSLVDFPNERVGALNLADSQNSSNIDGSRVLLKTVGPCRNRAPIILVDSDVAPAILKACSADLSWRR
jgi:hypothetical protein